MIRERLNFYWNNKSLQTVMLIALAIRLVAVVFSKGYGMHDDHFLVIEASQSWVDDSDYNRWLPENNDEGKPKGHSMFYVGLHYLFFLFLKYIGITDPQLKMFWVRLIHALYSLLIPYLGYKIAERAGGVRNARQVGLILALLWFLPMLSVRNLVEVVCIPPIMLASWILFKHEHDKGFWPYILAGLIIGISISVRFHSVLFVGGIGLVFLFRMRIFEALLFGIFTFISVFITQITDLFLWGYPFAELIEYFNYNLTHKDDYIVQGMEMYFLLIGGVLIPPISLFLIYGYAREAKKFMLLFLPALVFFAFHTYFPNKQERFIVPVIPFVVILGVIGWNSFLKTSRFWLKHSRLNKAFWLWFWVLNSIVLLFISTTYSKRSRVEAMVYLSKQADFNNFILERSHHTSPLMQPRFYLGQWKWYYHALNNNADVYTPEYINTMQDKPNYVVFVEATNINERVAHFKSRFPNMQFMVEIKPSLVDRVVHWLNPVNKNESCYIYHL